MEESRRQTSTRVCEAQVDEKNVSRRKFLQTSFMAGAVLLTGCRGNRGPGRARGQGYQTPDSAAPKPAAFPWPDGNRAAVSLTFDDACASQITTGIPVLDNHGVKATFYVNTWGVEGHEDDWKKAIARGHEIGNHSLTHPCSVNYAFSRKNALEDYTLERMEKDILDASAGIEKDLRVRPKTFAYPCGQMFVGRGANCQSYVPLVAKHFIAGRGSHSGTVNEPMRSDLARLAAIDIDAGGLPRLKELVDLAVASGGWLILFGHEITPKAQGGLSVRTLESLCRYMLKLDKGVWVDTVANIATYVLDARKKVTQK